MKTMLFYFGNSLQRFVVAARWPIIALATAILVETAGAGAATNVTIYIVKGVFKESRSDGRIAVVAHESIPGFMDAMTMPFNVKWPAELAGLKPGDEITFRLSVTATEDWIDEIKNSGARAPIPKSAQTQPAVLVPELNPGAMLPDVVLTNQSGQAFHVADFKGRALAFTFFFSRCPLPTFCPRMNGNLAAVQHALQSDATRTNWQLISISFDPEFDTPKHLADFAKLYQSDPNHWSFATSSPEMIRILGGSFGLMFWRENGMISHNLRTVVADATGRVQKIFTGNEWQPNELIAEMKKAMEAKP
jgi:protein SCO1/2